MTWIVFCPFDRVEEGDLGSKFSFVFVDNLPRYAQFYVDRRTAYGKILLAYCFNTLIFFNRVLHACLKPD
jgi:hypothetical protein